MDSILWLRTRTQIPLSPVAPETWPSRLAGCDFLLPLLPLLDWPISSQQDAPYSLADHCIRACELESPLRFCELLRRVGTGGRRFPRKTWGTIHWAATTHSPCVFSSHHEPEGILQSRPEMPLFYFILFYFSEMPLMKVQSQVWWKIRLQCRRPGFSPWTGKIPCRREWQPTPKFLPGESHGQRNPAGYSPWGPKKSDMTKWLFHFFFLSIHLCVTGALKPRDNVVAVFPAWCGCEGLRVPRCISWRNYLLMVYHSPS